MFGHRDQVGAEDNRLADGNGRRLPAGDFLGLLWALALLDSESEYQFVWYVSRFLFLPFVCCLFLLSSPIRFAETSRTLRLRFPFRKLFGKKNLLTLRGILGGLHNPVGIEFYLGFRLGLGSRWWIWEFGTLFGSVLGQKLVFMVCLPFSFSPFFPKKKTVFAKNLLTFRTLPAGTGAIGGFGLRGGQLGVLCDRVHHSPSVGIPWDSVCTEYCRLGDFFCLCLPRCLSTVGSLTGRFVQPGGVDC